ncbi:MAG: PaaI family thioesterase [Thermoplasmata archaeon]|nr:PaaI family thioesterase [Thermoplasmata archaeon]
MDIEELKTRMADDVVEYADRVMAMYGAPFARAMGVEIERIEKDRVVCSMELTPVMMNSMGRGHGAAIYTLIDHTFAIAANMVADGTGQSTEVKFYRPASGKLTAEAVPINRSRSLEVYAVKVFSEEGKLIASATCTSFMLRK